VHLAVLIVPSDCHVVPVAVEPGGGTGAAVREGSTERQYRRQWIRAVQGQQYRKAVYAVSSVSASLLNSKA
jgi:hypothetical protein